MKLGLSNGVFNNAAQLQQVKDFFAGSTGRTELAKAVAAAAGASSSNVEITGVAEVARVRTRALAVSNFYSVQVGFAIKNLDTQTAADRLGRKIGASAFSSRLARQVNE